MRGRDERGEKGVVRLGGEWKGEYRRVEERGGAGRRGKGRK